MLHKSPPPIQFAFRLLLHYKKTLLVLIFLPVLFTYFATAATDITVGFCTLPHATPPPKSCLLSLKQIHFHVRLTMHFKLYQ
jgi:hypothetical protein